MVTYFDENDDESAPNIWAKENTKMATFDLDELVTSEYDSSVKMTKYVFNWTINSPN